MKEHFKIPIREHVTLFAPQVDKFISLIIKSFKEDHGVELTHGIVLTAIAFEHYAQIKAEFELCGETYFGNFCVCGCVENEDIFASPYYSYDIEGNFLEGEDLFNDKVEDHKSRLRKYNRIESEQSPKQ